VLRHQAEHSAEHFRFPISEPIGELGGAQPKLQHELLEGRAIQILSQPEVVGPECARDSHLQNRIRPVGGVATAAP